MVNQFLCLGPASGTLWPYDTLPSGKASYILNANVSTLRRATSNLSRLLKAVVTQGVQALAEVLLPSEKLTDKQSIRVPSSCGSIRARNETSENIELDQCMCVCSDLPSRSSNGAVDLCLTRLLNQDLQEPARRTCASEQDHGSTYCFLDSANNARRRTILSSAL